MAKKDSKGLWIDAQGNHIPVKYIDPVDKKRDKMVCGLIKKAEKLQTQLRIFKFNSIEAIAKYLTDVEDIYNVKVKTKGGNKILTDFSNTIRVEIKIAKFIDFDDRLSLAKNLIDSCIKRWSEGSNDKIKLLVDDAFKVDKQGNLDKNRILSLRKLKIKDKEWDKAMLIIADSVKVIGRREYLRFSKKDRDGIWHSLPLDIAAIQSITEKQ